MAPPAQQVSPGPDAAPRKRISRNFGVSLRIKSEGRGHPDFKRRAVSGSWI
jgi:hypothetical protein